MTDSSWKEILSRSPSFGRSEVRPTNAETVVTAMSSAMPANRNQMMMATMPPAVGLVPSPAGARRVARGDSYKRTPDRGGVRPKDAIPRRFGCAADRPHGYGSVTTVTRASLRRVPAPGSSGDGEPGQVGSIDL